MTVHTLVLFENGAYTEISKEFDLSVHNSIINPKTNDLVQDNYMTFFYPSEDDDKIVFDYAKAHDMHLIEGWEVSEEEQKHWTELTPEESVLFNIAKPFPEGFKMFRIHYWTQEPIHWELNPESDLFVFNSNEIQSMVLFN